MVPPMLKNTFSLQVDSVTHPPYSAVLRKNNRWASLVSHEAILTPDPDLRPSTPQSLTQILSIRPNFALAVLYPILWKTRSCSERNFHAHLTFVWQLLERTTAIESDKFIERIHKQAQQTWLQMILQSLNTLYVKSFRGRFINFHILKNFAEFAFLFYRVFLMMKQRLQMFIGSSNASSGTIGGETWICESSLAQHRIERTSERADARSWPGSRRLAAARKLASSSQSAWLGASSLLRGLETPKRTHHRVAHPRERVSSGDSCRRGKRCQIFGSLRRLKVAHGAFTVFYLCAIDDIHHIER